MNHLGWDYELPGDPGDPENFYHIYPTSDEAEDAFDDGAFTIKVPQSSEMDEIIKEFVAKIDAYLDRHPAVSYDKNAPLIYIKLFG